MLHSVMRTATPRPPLKWTQEVLHDCARDGREHPSIALTQLVFELYDQLYNYLYKDSREPFVDKVKKLTETGVSSAQPSFNQN